MIQQYKTTTRRLNVKYVVRAAAMVAIIFGVANADAATHYLVPSNAGAQPPYTNWATAGTSVIDVVKVAMNDGDTPKIVWVTNGVYGLTNNVIAITNDVVIRSLNGRGAAIFNGNALYNFYLKHNDSVLDGLTITNGYSLNGGGIVMSGGTVTNCLITDCKAQIGGGIAILVDTWPKKTYLGTCIVANCAIRNNISTTGMGGGINISDSLTYALIKNCIIENNQALTSHGGGIRVGYSTGDAVATIENCLIRYNRVDGGSVHGGGIAIISTNTLVINCTIVSNYSPWASGGVAFGKSSTNAVVNCIVYNNAPGNLGGWSATRDVCMYSCSMPSGTYFNSMRTGNKTDNPGFASFATGDYRFNRYSPCYNSGLNQDWMTNAVDLDGHARILHGTVDMGAYEVFIQSGTMFRFR